jgi:hypothetical protein
MQVSQSRTASDHHPHRKFWIGWRAYIPLIFSNKKLAHLLDIQGAKHGI